MNNLITCVLPDTQMNSFHVILKLLCLAAFVATCLARVLVLPDVNNLNVGLEKKNNSNCIATSLYTISCQIFYLATITGRSYTVVIWILETFEYPTCWEFGFQIVWYSNGRLICYVLCSRPTIQIPDQYLLSLRYWWRALKSWWLMSLWIRPFRFIL